MENEEKDLDMNWSAWQSEQLKALEHFKSTNKKMFKNDFSTINNDIEELIKKSYENGKLEQEKVILEAIKNAANSSNNLVDFVNIVKSKRYTQTRIQRILIYALLGITNSKMLAFKKAVPYARVLGFNENGKQLISQIAKKNKKVQIVTSVKKYMDESKNKVLKEMLETDILATNVYTLGYEKDSWSNLDYTNKLVTM